MINRKIFIGFLFVLALSLALLGSAKPTRAWTIVEPEYSHSHDETEPTNSEHAPPSSAASASISPNQPTNTHTYVPPPAPAYPNKIFPIRARTYTTPRLRSIRSYPVNYYLPRLSYSYVPVVYYGSYFAY